MAISFPSTPTLNQVYTYNNKIWTYTGTHWVTTGPNSYPTNTPVAPITVSDTVPGATTQGSLWIDSTTGTLSVYVSGSWVLASAGVINVAANSIPGTAITDSSITASKLAAGAAVPTQTGNSGKFLTTDGTSASWANTTSNLTITSNLTSTGTASLGAVGNVKITGGTNGQLVSTDGTGNLSFINAPSSFNAGKAYTLNLLFGG